MPEQIEIDAIIRTDEIYPRSNIDKNTVEQYRQAIDKLPPIIVNKNMLLIDGAHRIEAHRNEDIAFIDAEIVDIPDKDVYAEAVKLNVSHGKQLTPKEKKNVGLKLYDEKKDNRDTLIELLSVDASTVDRWTKNIRGERAKRLKQEQNETILNMWFEGKTQEETGKAVGLTGQAVGQRIESLTQMRGTFKDIKTFNLWKFQAPDTAFGIEYPGRIPGQILVNLLHYYTDVGDTVYDPFGGGGVTIDVCRYMMRRYKVYDIAPKREDIKQWDVVKQGVAVDNAKLTFLDPPYWKQKKGDYSEHETNLANMSLNKFHDALQKIIIDCQSISEYVALLIGPTQEKWEFKDHAAEMMIRLGSPYHRIQVPYTTQIHGGNYVNMAKENKQWLYLTRDLMIWKVPLGSKE